MKNESKIVLTINLLAITLLSKTYLCMQNERKMMSLKVNYDSFAALSIDLL
jgi:hypothetical protein